MTSVGCCTRRKFLQMIAETSKRTTIDKAMEKKPLAVDHEIGQLDVASKKVKLLEHHKTV